MVAVGSWRCGAAFEAFGCLSQSLSRSRSLALVLSRLILSHSFAPAPSLAPFVGEQAQSQDNNILHQHTLLPPPLWTRHDHLRPRASVRDGQQEPAEPPGAGQLPLRGVLAACRAGPLSPGLYERELSLPCDRPPSAAASECRSSLGSVSADASAAATGPGAVAAAVERPPRFRYLVASGEPRRLTELVEFAVVRVDERARIGFTRLSFDVSRVSCLFLQKTATSNSLAFSHVAPSLSTPPPPRPGSSQLVKPKPICTTAASLPPLPGWPPHHPQMVSIVAAASIA